MNTLQRRVQRILLAAALSLPLPALAAGVLQVYKSPYCGCCQAWVEHMTANGFDVRVQNTGELNQIKQQHGISRELASCHTALIDGYVIEGHVPAADVQRLLGERPDVRGLAVPGMPMGSPGMEGPRTDRYDVLTFDAQGRTAVYTRY